jgi:hypothetical protein
MTAVIDIGAFPPATSVVECDGHRHRIYWEAGGLLAPDHGDPRGERALAVLGGKDVACMDVLKVWAEHRHDPRLLSVLTRGPGDSTGHTWGDADSQLPLLGQLAGEVQQRLVATVTAKLLNELASGEPGADRALPALEISLITRVKNSLSDWLDGALPDLQVDVAEEGGRPVVGQAGDGSLSATLPLRWVADIWGRGLAVVGGRFSLSLVEASSGRAVLKTISDDFQSPRLLTLELE